MSAVSTPSVPIWAVAGGKGGVGKSVVAALLCEALAQRELRVVAVDLDLAGCKLNQDGNTSRADSRFRNKICK